MKTIRIGVMSAEKFIQRTIDIAAGRYKVKKKEPEIWFSSVKSCLEVMCTENIQLIDIIVKKKPSTIKELELLTGRKQSNLSRTLHRLERYKLIKLVKENNQPLRPEAETAIFEIVVNPNDLLSSNNLHKEPLAAA